MVGKSKGMHRVKHLTQKILMTDNYCGRQLVRKLRWAALDNLKKDGATLRLERASITYKEVTYLDGRLIAGGNCLAAVTARISCWWV